MAFMTRSVLLALLSGIALGSKCATNLSVTLSQSADDYADLDVKWEIEKGKKGWLYVRDVNDKKVFEDWISEPKYTLKKMEFWTNYSIGLDSHYPYTETLKKTIYTGPGSPHTVASVKVAPSTVAAVVSMTESIMPRSVDRYVVTLCSVDGCKTTIHPRDTRKLSGVFRLELNELFPKTEYKLDITPEIEFDNRVYRAKVYMTKFSTKDITEIGPPSAPSVEVIRRTSGSLTFEVTSSNGKNVTSATFFTATNAYGDSFVSFSREIEIRNLKAYRKETVELRACYRKDLCSNVVSVVAQTSVAGPEPLSRLVGAVVNQTSLFFCWDAPNVSNGPLDGYYAVLRKQTNSTLLFKKLLPPTQTRLEYATTDEFETFTFTIRGLNFDKNKDDLPIFGELSSASVYTAASRKQ